MRTAIGTSSSVLELGLDPTSRNVHGIMHRRRVAHYLSALRDFLAA